MRHLPTMMRMLADEIRQDLLKRGFHYQLDFELDACLSLATLLGVPVGDKRNPELMRLISPQATGTAKPNTLSSRYGMGSFPFHTDAGYWTTPPRFILFHCVNPGAGDRSTLLVDSHEWHFTERDNRALCNEVWRVTTRRPFLCTVGTEKQGAIALRFDEACMVPVTKGAFHVRGKINEAVCETRPIPIRWQTNALLVIDNYRMLHARGEASSADYERVLARILIAEG